MDASAVRCRARYAVLLALGYDCRRAKEGANTVSRFVELVRLAGREPSDFGDLGVRLPSGRRRVDTPKSRRRTALYHALRALGASSAEASEASKSEALYDRLVQALLSARQAGVQSEAP